MSLKDLNRHREEREQEIRASFQKRLIAQQFLNDAKPLILAAVDKIDGDESSLKALLDDVAAAFNEEGKGKDFDDIRVERILAVEVAALALSSGKKNEEIANVVRGIFDRYCSSPLGVTEPFPSVSASASVAMTSANVAATLALAVYECSLMQSTTSDLDRLCRAVYEEVSHFISAARPEGDEDVRSLTQTASNKGAELMSVCYRTACARAEGRGLECDPVDMAIDDFGRLMRTWCTAALSYAEMVMNPVEDRVMTP